MLSFMSLRNHSAVLDSPRPGRIMNFWSSISFSFTIDHFAFIYHRSPRCRQPSTIATPRCHSPSTPALAFTIDRCAFIHHRPQRFHLGLICSVSGYVKFLSKGKHIKSWYICGHKWVLAKDQTHFYSWNGAKIVVQRKFLLWRFCFVGTNISNLKKRPWTYQVMMYWANM